MRTILFFYLNIQYDPVVQQGRYGRCVREFYGSQGTQKNLQNYTLLYITQ